ncbi:MAG: hypothetical protein AAFX00_06640, partial [Pseudomonadota bacterium]
ICHLLAPYAKNVRRHRGLEMKTQSNLNFFCIAHGRCLTGRGASPVMIERRTTALWQVAGARHALDQMHAVGGGITP